jgi:hypothetical protein
MTGRYNQGSQAQVVQLQLGRIFAWRHLLDVRDAAAAAAAADHGYTYLTSLSKACVENLRSRPPHVPWSSTAADSHAKDVSALREHLITSAKGWWRVFVVQSLAVPVTYSADATHSWVTQATSAKNGSHTLVIDGEPFKLCKR